MTQLFPDVTVRASSAVDCPRKAIYEAKGAPARDRTDRERRILFRGKRIGADYVTMLRARYGDDAIEAERKVPWPNPDGPFVGHVDAYLKAEKLCIEVLSSRAGMAQIERKMTQVAFYTVFDPDAGDRARVVLLDPVDYSEDRLDFTVDAEWRARVEEIAATVARSLADGTLPERVCNKPSDAISHFCLYAETCFEGWEPPAPEIVVDDPKVRALAAALFHAKQAERIVRKQLAVSEGQRKELEAELAGLLDPGEYRVGPLVVKRTHVEMKPRFDAMKAELQGYPLPDDCWRPGSSYDKFTVERDGDEPLVSADDFGSDEDVPW